MSTPLFAGSPLVNETILPDLLASPSAFPALTPMEVDGPETAEPSATVAADAELHQLEVLRQIADATELLPTVIQLIEDVKAGRISVQDFGNHAGPLRRQLYKARQKVLSELDGLEETNEERDLRIQELKLSIKRKEQLLERFTQTVEKRFNLSSPPETKPETQPE